jgi:hypothetical protein
VPQDTITPWPREPSTSGLPQVDDFDGDVQNGVARYLLNVVAVIRQNTGIAYVTDEIRRRPNLTIRGRVELDRLLISRGEPASNASTEPHTTPRK